MINMSRAMVPTPPIEALDLVREDYYDDENLPSEIEFFSFDESDHSYNYF
jgi:hypothetical protein